jgi:aryl-phospho-beta-D-glucosidase BglC (GH1 family)
MPTEGSLEAAGGPPAGVLGSGPRMYPTGPCYRGISRAGAEFGDQWDGWTGQTYYSWPNTNVAAGGMGSFERWAAELDYAVGKGFNTIRLPISWERLQHNLGGEFNIIYQTALLNCVTQATTRGLYVIIDIHNYNRFATGTHANEQGTGQVQGYSQQILSDGGTLTTAHLCNLWAKLALLFVGNAKVIFELMNEPHWEPPKPDEPPSVPMTSTQWMAAQNAVIVAIRNTGATQLILTSNSRGSDVDHWYSVTIGGGPPDSVAALDLVDPGSNFAHALHAYWVPDAANGTPARYTSYVALLQETTTWARDNGQKLFLTEFGTSVADGQAQIAALLDFLEANGDVWLGWAPWNLAPYLLTQTSYVADGPQMPWYEPYLSPSIVDGATSATFPTDPPKTLTKGARIEYQSGDIPYWLIVPDSYDETHETPTKLLVWLHGCGGASVYDVFHAAIAPRDFIVMAPGAREGLCWQAGSSNIVSASIANARTHFNIEPKIYLGGYSSGGDIGYKYAFEHSEVIAGCLFQNTRPFQAPWGAYAAYAAAKDKFPIAHLAAISDGTYALVNVRGDMNLLKAAGYPVRTIEKAGTHFDPDLDPVEGSYSLDSTWYAARTFLLTLIDSGWDPDPAPATPPPFDPFTDAGPIFAYWDAANAVVTSGLVDSIPNTSGYGTSARTLQKVGVAGPTYNAASAHFNGQASVSSTLPNRRVQATFDSIQVQPYTVYHVLRAETNTTTVYWRTNAGNFDDSPGFTLQSDRRPRAQVANGGGAITSTSALMTAGANYVHCGVYSGAASALYFNNSATPNASSPAQGSLGTNGAAVLTIGSFTTGVNYEWACCIIYAGAHDAATRQNVMRWLGAKYGIATT